MKTQRNEMKKQEAVLIGERLKSVRKTAGFSLQEVADRLNRDFGANINKGMISKYENGIHEPSAGTIHCLSLIFGVPADYLMGRTDAPDAGVGSDEQAESGHLIKVYSRFNLTDGGDIEKDAAEFIPSGWLTGGHEFFGLKILSSEFAPRYYEGDIVIFEFRTKIPADRVSMVSIGENDAFLCHIVRKRNGKIITPLDRRREQMFFTTEQFEQDDIHIIGTAVQVRRME